MTAAARSPEREAAPTPAAEGGRVRFGEAQLLRARDLAAEQEQRLSRRRRHDRAAHRWGIVAGLGLAVAPAGGALVEIGVAVDGYGRQIRVATPITLDGATLDALAARAGADAVDVWLLAGEAPATAPQRRSRECGTEHDRWAEAPRVRLIPVADATVAPEIRCPPEVTASDLGPGVGGRLCRDAMLPAHRREPHCREWPVFLGRLHVGTAQADPDVPRPFAGLVGEQVVSPSGEARVQVGGERPGDPIRFAVELGSTGAPPAPRLMIDGRGPVTVHGHTVLRGELELGAAPIGRGIALSPMSAPPEAAAPWQIYRAVEGQPPATSDQLRLEIGHPGGTGDPALNALTVGRLDAGGFERCMAVRADCAVVVGSRSIELAPGAKVVQAPAGADLEDPRFAAAIVAQWLDSIVKTGIRLDALYAGLLRATATHDETATAGSDFHYEVVLRNVGPVRLTAVTLVHTLVADDDVLHRETVQRDALEAICEQEDDPDCREIAGATVAIPSDRAGDTLTLSATAVALGPGGYPVAAAAGPIEIEIGGGP